MSALRADQTLSPPEGTAHFRPSCQQPVHKSHKAEAAGPLPAAPLIDPPAERPGPGLGPGPGPGPGGRRYDVSTLKHVREKSHQTSEAQLQTERDELIQLTVFRTQH